MEVTTTTRAELDAKDIAKAIAEYASKYRAGDFVFDESTVELFDDHDNRILQATAWVKTKK